MSAFLLAAPHAGMLHPHHARLVAHVMITALVVHLHVHVTVRAAAAKAARPFLRLLAGVLVPKRLISVVTPTWNRLSLLTKRCIPSVRAQSYTGPVEHLIISDGPDERLSHLPGVTFLPRHEPAPNRGINARRYGADLARGDLIAYLDDDNAWWFNHLEILVRALDDSDADFAYSQALCTEPHGYRWTIGSEPPGYSQIDTSMIVHRRELLVVANWQPSPGPADWDLVSRWVDAGAKWVHVPAVTVDYYARSMPVTASAYGHP